MKTFNISGKPHRNEVHTNVNVICIHLDLTFLVMSVTYMCQKDQKKYRETLDNDAVKIYCNRSWWVIMAKGFIRSVIIHDIIDRNIALMKQKNGPNYCIDGIAFASYIHSMYESLSILTVLPVHYICTTLTRTCIF